MTTPFNIKDRYIGVEYYGCFQFYEIPKPQEVIVIIPFFTTLLELRTRDGGLKKRWFYHQAEDNPIESIKVEVTEKGFGICKVVFSDLMFPVEASDIVRIFFAGNPFYEGIVDNNVDPSYPEMTASPFWKRYTECTFTGSYPTGTGIRIILQNLVDTLESFTGVKWNSEKVDLGDTPPILAVEYQASECKGVIDQLIEIAGASYYWGVDEERDFFVRRYLEDPEVDFRFYANEDAPFEKISIKEDYSRIEMTEALVYKKVDGGGEAEFIGSIGDAGNIDYPQLPIVFQIRPKIGKITASESWSSVSALNWAYEHLKKHVDTVKSVKISNIALERFFPAVGKTVMVEDGFKRSMELMVDCESTTGWSNVSLVSAQGKNGRPAIKLFADGLTDSYYDFDRPVHYYNQEKLGLYIKASIDSVIEIAFSMDEIPAESEFVKFAVSDDGVLCYRDFDHKTEFQYIHFKYVDDTVYVDDIMVFCETKKQETTTIKKVSITWNDKGIFCDAEGGYIQHPETDELNKLNRKIKILEAINNI